MEADKMFEKLGYEKTKEKDELSYYNKGEKRMYGKGGLKSYEYGTDRKIEFYKETKTVKAYCYSLQYDHEDCSIAINMQELQAINKKCKELGWIE